MTAMRKFFNRPKDAVREEVQGYCQAFADKVRLVEPGFFVARAKPKAHSKVAMCVGNGSGHEPALFGFVGLGLFDAVVPGEFFTAPPGDRIFEAMKHLNRDAGVLCLVANHEGDVLNANLALELAEDEGLHVDSLLLYDDIATAPRGQERERRGIAGMMFAIKVAGAAAEAGLPLAEVKRLGQKAIDHTRTLSVALSSCTNPMTAAPMFAFEDGMMEVGMGVHGEPAMKKSPVTAADETMDYVAAQVLDDMPFVSGDEVVAILNGCGATTLMEMFILFRRLHQACSERGISIYRSLIGEYITTQEMAGFSLSLCKMDSELKPHWLAPADAPYFKALGD